VNDTVREYFYEQNLKDSSSSSSNKNEIKIHEEMASGAAAGICQVCYSKMV